MQRTKEITRVACRCCGSEETKQIGSKPGAFVQQRFHYFRCNRCAFIFVDPCLGPEIYDDAYYQGAGADPFVDYEAEYTDYKKTDRVLEFHDLVRVAKELLTVFPLKREVIEWFDFGCGSGGLLRHLRGLGSIELGSTAVPVSVCGHDVGVYADKLRDADGFRILDVDALHRLPDSSFDIISMIEVLEHVPYPAEVIRLAARLLKPGGVLLLTTGNLGSPVARYQGVNYRYCISEVHVSLFTLSSLALLYNNVGLKPIEVRYRGVVAFKTVKSVTGALKKAVVRLLIKLPLVVRVIDFAYGVSKMPCAIKPLSVDGTLLESLAAPRDTRPSV